MRKSVVVAAVLCLALALLLPGTSAVAQKKKKGPVVVATDPADDWGANVDPSIAPAGTALGMEITEAALALSDDKTALNFIITLNTPTGGGLPETVRYGWEFTVDGDAYQLNGGRTELLRGMCNPLITDPACPPNVGDPVALTNFPFFVRSGTCTAGADCTVHAVVNAVFDATAGTITVPVPLEAIGAKLGSTIGPFGGTFGAVYAAPGVVVTVNSVPNDNIALVKPYKIPKK